MRRAYCLHPSSAYIKRHYSKIFRYPSSTKFPHHIQNLHRRPHQLHISRTRQSSRPPYTDSKTTTSHATLIPPLTYLKAMQLVKLIFSMGLTATLATGAIITDHLCTRPSWQVRPTKHGNKLSAQANHKNPFHSPVASSSASPTAPTMSSSWRSSTAPSRIASSSAPTRAWLASAAASAPLPIRKLRPRPSSPIEHGGYGS